MKTIVLFAFVLFGVYALHQAGKKAKKIRLDEKRITRFENEIREEDRVLMRRALALSHITVTEGQRFQSGSIVVKNGKIVGEGWNKTKQKFDASAHAEVEAIREACKNLSTDHLKDCTLYVSASPCPMCLSLIYLAGIEKVFYHIPGKRDSINKSLSAGQIYVELAKPRLERSIPEIPVMEAEMQ
jgi:tRNA(Arg) A34 adenosine deaminase TadA